MKNRSWRLSGAISLLSFCVASCGDENNVATGGSARSPQAVAVSPPPPSPPSVTPPATVKAQLQFLVPAYFYPAPSDPNWDRMTAQARLGAKITAIMSPAIGPGLVVDANYKREVDEFRQAGGKVLGYVPSGFTGSTSPSTTSSCQPTGGRTTYNPQDVINCAVNYAALYNVDGIFVDEMNVNISSGMIPAQSLIFYQAVYNGIKSFRSSWIVFGNPGAEISESFLRIGTNGAADTLVIIENYARDLPASPRPAYLKNYAGDRFGGILHSANSYFDYSLALTAFRFRNISYVYLTDDVLDPNQGLFNPYDQLPTNWEAQVSLLRVANAQ